MGTELSAGAGKAPAESILIVDDTAENVVVLAELLAPDYRISVASSGERALVLAQTGPTPDLILLDVKMPGLDGYAVLDALRSHPRTADIPVIFVTAMGSEHDEELGMAAGAVDYIIKPIRAAVVRARVRTQLDAKRAREFMRDKNSFLETEIQRRVEAYDTAKDVSIRALARLAETRDPETGNHILRTQEYVYTLAMALRNHPRFVGFLTPRFIDLLRKSAPLHDIGKVGIPDHILRKPGQLTAAEWNVMQTHASLGSEALEQAERDEARPLEFLRIAKQVARHHHEKWDGTGYPDGLAGEEIPVAARLMALADVFDALISRRVYKEPIAHERARDMIVASRGRQFDPAVTDAFVEHFEQFKAIACRYADAENGDVAAQ
ncbi:MAG: response regulator [Rhodocyclaceae bacterium]|nr:response regulator [Rhodocyclaceae bacterium]MBX3670151.1 response regulator [Rhodocyclaceae bacterium]